MSSDALDKSELARRMAELGHAKLGVKGRHERAKKAAAASAKVRSAKAAARRDMRKSDKGM